MYVVQFPISFHVKHCLIFELCLSSMLSPPMLIHAGALYLADNATASLSNSRFERLAAAFSGGAAYIRDSSSLSISNSTVQGSLAQWGAGFLCDHYSRLALSKSVLQGNGAAKQGGGITALQRCKVRSKQAHFCTTKTTGQLSAAT
jgi:hypothetical protein